jgi:phospholipid/cholesterol/gamma-HCH transport system substrate-binding protein
VSEFGTSLGAINSLLNELAYKPKDSRESFLFYLPWLNHDLNATFNLADAGGPIGRGVIMISCNGSSLLDGFAKAEHPYVKTFVQGARLPGPKELPPIPPDPSLPSIYCGPESE